MGSHKMGRPTSDPKTLSVKIRISKQDKDRLDYLVNEKSMTKSDVIREGIKRIYDENK